MTETLQPTLRAYDHLMSSQSGNIQDLNAYSGLQSPPFIIASDAEPDSTFRHEFSHNHPTLPSEMGLRYMAIPASDDARFPPEGTPQHSPVYSVEPNLTSSTPSTVPFFSNVFPPALSNSSSYSNTPPSYLSSSLSNFCLPDIKQNFNSFSSASDMPPPARSPHLPQINSPVSTRDLYSTSNAMRGIPLSPGSSSGFTSPPSLDSPQLANNPNGPPPLNPTELLYQTIQTSDGQQIRPEIIGKIDKGFFLAENDWTCYRRNYFQISCSYTLHPNVPAGTTILLAQGGQTMQVEAFAMSIAAVVDGEHGKPVELVQHTPKRDKGPQMKPDRVVLLPRPVNTTTLYNNLNGSVGGSASSDPSSLGAPSRSSLFDQNYAAASSQPPSECTFERIQFKQATANNGKRRARQQYYHLVIELYADLGPAHGPDARWAKIARRLSAQMVVRGRSPGHYHAERRGSNASAGPPNGGSAGSGMGGGGGYGAPGNGLLGGGGAVGLLPGGGGYAGAYDVSRSRRYALHAGLEIPPEPALAPDEERAFHDLEGYFYYAQPHVHEVPGPGRGGYAPHREAMQQQQQQQQQQHHQQQHHQQHHQQQMGYPRVKQEYAGFSLPSLAGGDAYNRHCGGRFEVPTARGPAGMLAEVNTS